MARSVIERRVRPLTFDEVVRMTEAGILDAHERVELIDGRLVAMTPEGFGHARSVWDLTAALARRYPNEYRVGSQTALYLDEHAYVVPDVFVMVEAPQTWPRPDQVPLVVEVAQSSVAYDLGEKAAIYATWGARTYWVVDLTRREVVVHTGPEGGAYAAVTTVSENGALPLPGIEASVPVSQVLPPR